MKILREATTGEIIRDLDRSFFTKHAFETSFNNKNGETARIVFRDNTDFKFVITQSGSGASWKTSECPGVTFTECEEYDIRDFSTCRSRISGWVQRILEEYMVPGKGTEAIFQQMRDNLYKNSEELPEPEKPFNAKESAAWGERLDALIEKFEKLRKDNQIQQGELNTLKREVKDLKEKIESVPKKTWVKAAGNKILDSLEKLANTKVGIGIVEGTIRALLGGGGAG